ncbi:hypothetical protein [Tenacibaculum sp. 47A_GOM-205m]|uniref:hypothetical protein n=1 Tax=Tenacibaculum sp. 47A_GOM-205m TaxID=1380384 RepID=UPI0012DCC869|nr:hypothetical protein [Tenacibaculum sp. 47A_GOM-205m]
MISIIKVMDILTVVSNYYENKMSQTKIIFKKSPLLEISFNNTHIHIVDFEIEKNNVVIYYDEIQNIELVNKSLLIEFFNKEIEIKVGINNISNAKKIVSEIKKLKTSKEILYPKTDYKQESFEEFKKRYNGYGKEIHAKLKNKNPELFDKLKFYQMIDQPEDSFSEYIDNGKSFIIQLDYYSELIIISNNKKHFEIGNWEKDEIKKSINFILKELI